MGNRLISVLGMATAVGELGRSVPFGVPWGGAPRRPLLTRDKSMSGGRGVQGFAPRWSPSGRPAPRVTRAVVPPAGVAVTAPRVTRAVVPPARVAVTAPRVTRRGRPHRSSSLAGGQNRDRDEQEAHRNRVGEDPVRARADALDRRLRAAPRAGRGQTVGMTADHDRAPALGRRGRGLVARREAPVVPIAGEGAAALEAMPRVVAAVPIAGERAAALEARPGVVAAVRRAVVVLTAGAGLAAHVIGAGEAAAGHAIEDVVADPPVGHRTAAPPGQAGLIALVVVEGPAGRLVFWHVEQGPLPRLTGLADGLAPEERRYGDLGEPIRPTCRWVPRFPPPTGTQRMRAASYRTLARATKALHAWVF